MLTNKCWIIRFLTVSGVIEIRLSENDVISCHFIADDVDDVDASYHHFFTYDNEVNIREVLGPLLKLAVPKNEWQSTEDMLVAAYEELKAIALVRKIFSRINKGK